MKQQYISAVKDEIKSKQGYDRRLVKRKSSIGVGMGAPSMKQFQKDRLEKVALSNFSRDDYQKSVSYYGEFPLQDYLMSHDRFFLLAN